VPSPDHDSTQELTERVRHAAARHEALRIVGGDTKRFLGRAVDAAPLEVGTHRGILSYEPAELVVTVRAGTPLRELQDLLAAHGQHLPFEPPAFGVAATVGGAVAAGLAGPARVSRGPVRDYVLGARMLTGDGRVLKFGGEVMKNVAGYDVSRLLAGSLGTLGVILDVSLKVLPAPVAARTLHLELDAAAAGALLGRSVRVGLPVTASFWCDGHLHARVEGSPGALDETAAALGGDPLEPATAAALWHDVREQRHAFFAAMHRGADSTLWRLHAPAGAPVAAFDRLGRWAFEWHGMQRWVVGGSREQMSALARETGGHATLFRGVPAGGDAFEPLPAPLLALHRNVKRVFDPAGILNPGRLYADL
jgi:glycolate oxidase FAD binding subunit